MIGKLQSKPALRTQAQYASGHLVITDSLHCPWGKKALTYSLNSTRLIRTPHYYGQFALSLGKESLYIFSKFNLLNTNTLYGPLTVLTGFHCTFCMTHLMRGQVACM